MNFCTRLFIISAIVALMCDCSTQDRRNTRKPELKPELKPRKTPLYNPETDETLAVTSSNDPQPATRKAELKTQILETQTRKEEQVRIDEQVQINEAMNAIEEKPKKTVRPVQKQKPLTTLPKNRPRKAQRRQNHPPVL